MTTSRTRYFVIVSLLILTIGLGTGLVAYYVGLPAGASTSAVPDELRFVPPNASLVAYADVRAVMVSQVRQRLLDVLPLPSSGQKEFENQTGINIDTDVDYLVACLTPPAQGSGLPLAGMALVRGRFNAVKIESLMRDRGARVEEYKGSRVLAADVHAPQAGVSEALSLAFLEPGLVALGSTAVVHAAVDLKAGGANVTTNGDVMSFVKSFAGNDAWAVGRFDALTAEAKLPQGVTAQMPAITWFSAAGHIDGGIAGTFRADATTEEAANNLRDLLRGVMAFAKLQIASRPDLRPMLDSLQLGGAGNSVTLAFDVTPQMFEQLTSALKGLRGSPLTPSK
jgi:hypothetical protein